MGRLVALVNEAVSLLRALSNPIDAVPELA